MDDYQAPALWVRDLTRRYGRVVAVASMDLVVSAGQVFGLLGPAGAGKTTLLRMCCGLIYPDAGTVRVCGYDVWLEARPALERLGYLGTEVVNYPYLSGGAFLRLMGEQHGLTRRGRRQKRIDDLRLRLGIDPAELEPSLATRSYATRKKIELASLLLREPDVLFLDEPMLGLDASSARRVGELLQELAARGRTVILSTPLAEVARSVCHHVGIMERGRLVSVRSADDPWWRPAAPGTPPADRFLRMTTAS